MKEDQTHTINVGLVVQITIDEEDRDVIVPFQHDFEAEAVWVYIKRSDLFKALELEERIQNLPTWWEQASDRSDLVRRSDVYDLIGGRTPSNDDHAPLF